jgi:hypothetical protein
MKNWAVHAPMNFQHKYQLIEAEKARVLGNNWQAIELYDQAIAGAKEHKYLHEEALANELAAKFYLSFDKEKIAKTYLIDAYYCYANWGARAKIESLETTYSHLLEPIINQTKTKLTAGEVSTLISKPSLTGVSALLDLETVTKASLAIASEIQIDKLLGVADFGYDFYLLAIAKLLHGQYFRLLDFYFHTLIQQRQIMVWG